MIESRCRASFLFESPQAFRVCGKLFPEHLDGHVAL
jgi:hypothetical protein